MKYILIILVQTIAFVIGALVLAIKGLWKFDFTAVKGLKRDYLETVSYPIYKLTGHKTKHFPRYNRF